MRIGLGVGPRHRVARRARALAAADKLLDHFEAAAPLTSTDRVLSMILEGRSRTTNVAPAVHNVSAAEFLATFLEEDELVALAADGSATPAEALEIRRSIDPVLYAPPPTGPPSGKDP